MINENFLNIAIIFCVILIIVLAIVLLIVYLNMRMKRNRSTTTVKVEEVKEGDIPKSKTFAVRTVMDFMEFDSVEDNMIVQKN